MKRIYADYNATTPLDPRVFDAMLPYLREHFGNASSVHVFGRETRAAIDDARVRLAALLGAQEGEIVFTGGGTEADNMAVFGVARALRKKGRHIVTSSIEHHAVLHACQYLEKTGECEVAYLPVNRECVVDPDDLRKAIRKDTVLVSVMSANNETGTIQPIKELAAICRERGVVFHTDAVQSFGKQPVQVSDWGVDLLSIAAHKFYGPKGVGALYIRRGTKVDPLQFGGSHENDRRAGTENVAAIVGLAKAAELATATMGEEQCRLFGLCDRLAAGIAERIGGAHRNGHPTQRIGNTINFSFEGCEEEGLLLGLDLEGVAVSSGSACAVGSLEPSHVLKAMGLPHELARAAVRFSFGKNSTAEDANYIIEALGRVVERLRQFART
ncbi:MAG TPA: cysteine desulfurase family protein [Verrucomicrobiae bacterium]|nr:cysteine desulfurase family protein [Verrucomicrobiae bacterium]